MAYLGGRRLFFCKMQQFENHTNMEQIQTKLSKYAAKQRRLATDPAFGTDYSDKIKDQIADAIERQKELLLQ